MADVLIGLTGGVASGKTAASRCFEAIGITVADADVAAREAVTPGSVALDAIVETFGHEVLDDSGVLDRAAMRRRVFADASARAQLEAIIHPHVRAQLRRACEAAPGPYVIAAIPLLAEGGRDAAYPWLRRVLVIDVPVNVQLARLLARDGIDEELAQRMIAAQATREQRLSVADDVIVNDGTLAALEEAVLALHRQYLGLASGAA